MQELKAAIFDLDGLMLDTETLSKEVWLSVATEEKSPIDADLYQRLIGRTYPDIERMVTEAFRDRDKAKAYIDRCLEIYFQRIHEPLRTMPGLHRMLDWCDAKGLKKAVGTSTGRSMAEVKLKSGGIDGRFEAVVTGCDVAKGKPDPEVFLKCAAALGAKPSEAMVLEDSPSGVLAAHNGGIRVIMIPNMIQPDETIRSAATAVLASLAEVPAYAESQGWV